MQMISICVKTEQFFPSIDKKTGLLTFVLINTENLLRSRIMQMISIYVGKQFFQSTQATFIRCFLILQIYEPVDTDGMKYDS